MSALARPEPAGDLSVKLQMQPTRIAAAAAAAAASFALPRIPQAHLSLVAMIAR